MLQGDVKEIAGAARRIKHGDLAKPFVETVHLGAGFFKVARAGLGDGGGADIFPLGAERFNDGRQHQPLDIGARRVVGAKLVALVRVQGAFQQRAENGGFDLTPILPRGFFQQAELQAVDRQNGVVGKQTAVEVQKLFAQHHGNALAGAGVHFAEQVAALNPAKPSPLAGSDSSNSVKLCSGNKLDILGEHAKQAAREKLRDDLGSWPACFQRLGQFGQMAGNFAGDIGGVFRRVKRGGIRPDEPEPFADFLVGADRSSRMRNVRGSGNGR